MLMSSLIKKFVVSLLALGICSGSLARQQQEPQQEQQQLYRVVTTIAQLAEPLSQITGGCVAVESLLGSGTDPHLYRLTRADVLKMRSADMLFYVGHLLEAQMIHLLDELAATKPVYGLGEMLMEEHLLEVAEGVYDPHLWMDPLVWREVLVLAAAKISAEVPSCRSAMRIGSRDYFARLDRIDQLIETSLDKVPPARRLLVTSHDAFSYFGRRYDIEVLAIQGLSTDRQVSIRKLDQLIDQLVERRVEMVFIESSVSERNMRAVIEGAASQGHYVRLGGVLFSDAMGREGTREGTYLGMLAHNVNLIASSLGIQLSSLYLFDQALDL